MRKTQRNEMRINNLVSHLETIESKRFNKEISRAMKMQNPVERFHVGYKALEDLSCAWGFYDQLCDFQEKILNPYLVMLAKSRYVEAVVFDKDRP